MAITMRKKNQDGEDQMITVEVVPDPPVARNTEHEVGCKCCSKDKGTDPDAWTHRFPRYPHPSELDFGKFPGGLTRMDPTPAVCYCNNEHSMLVLQNTTLSNKKPADTAQLWCTLCWMAPHVTMERLKTAWKGDHIKFSDPRVVPSGAQEHPDKETSSRKTKKRVP